MARANNGGWDFVKVGKTYQYKEDSFIAIVKVLEDTSDDKNYRFKLQVEKATFEPPTEDGIFEISHDKDPGGYWSGMLQFYENEEYFCNYKWKRENETF
jgi:hypothetical protein